MKTKFELHTDNCTGCGRCTERCPYGVLRLADNGSGKGKGWIVVIADASRCRGSGHCVRSCPRGALELRRITEKDAGPWQRWRHPLCLALQCVLPVVLAWPWSSGAATWREANYWKIFGLFVLLHLLLFHMRLPASSAKRTKPPSKMQLRLKKFTQHLLEHAVQLAVLAAVTMWLWNTLVPDIIGWKSIGYGEACGLLVLAHLIFGHVARPSFRDRQHERHLYEAMQGMSHDEKRAFIRRRILRLCDEESGEEQPERTKETGRHGSQGECRGCDFRPLPTPVAGLHRPAGLRSRRGGYPAGGLSEVRAG